MTCRFLVFEDVLRSTIWTRLDLRQHAFRKGQRKKLARIRREFDVRVGPVVVDVEREAVYQAYRSTARGERSPSLLHFLYEDSGRDLFDTREVSIWRGDVLVAFSWFDVGKTCQQSLLGAFLPDEERWGLGYASMLLELEWGLQHGYHYHYSGYIMPGEPAMDYKLRAGDMQWLDTEGQWRSWDTFNPAHTPERSLSQALESVTQALIACGIPTATRDYPMFEAPAYDPSLSKCMTAPRVAECFPSTHTTSVLFITYDIDSHLYDVVRATRATGIVKPPDPSVRPRHVDLFLIGEPLGTFDCVEDVVSSLQRRLNPGRAT
jgi:arginyl-tRNA--protein-N-Asp/Glu arginylyltransferase